MSLNKKRREMVKNYILKQIGNKNSNYIQNTIENFEISKTTVYKYLRELRESGVILKTEKKEYPYELAIENGTFVYNTRDNLQEDIIFRNNISDYLTDFPKNVVDIWKYAFTEIMNNAIEHSGATTIFCVLQKNKLYTTVIIGDNGIGIFKKIQLYFKNELHREITLDEAVTELFAGKLTTAKANHSGEGIFFTSRAVDNFMILSGNKIFSHSSYTEFTKEIEEVASAEKKNNNEGTVVFMKLSNSSSKKLEDIMFKYSDVDKGFYKTILPIVNMIENGNPVSRSEARRLGTVISRFEEVTLDFENVENIGQAFVHELFVVFKKNNPNITIKITNANKNVNDMIKRVLNTDNSFINK